MTLARRAGWQGQAKLLRLAGAAAAIVVGGCTADRQEPLAPPVDPCSERPCDAAAVVTQLGQAYARRDYAHLARLLHDDFWFILHPDPIDPPQPESWGKTEELRLHRRMFTPQTIPTGEEPLPDALWLLSVTISLASAQSFAERPEYYRSATNPTGLDPARWKAWGADYDAFVLWDMRGATDYAVEGRAWFVVAQDLSKAEGEPGAYFLYRWQDLGGPTLQAARQPANWSRIKQLYRPRNCGEPCYPNAPVLRLQDAYRTRVYASYTKLFHDDFLFILHPDPNADPPPPENWDEQEELRIHRRMFEPLNIPPSDPPLEMELWLASISISLTQAHDFTESPEFYRSATNPDGLDPARWKAWGADYQAALLFDTAYGLDYQIMGRAWFVVAQDLAKPFGEPGRFTLYRWQDLGGTPGAGTTSVEVLTWSTVKLLYK